MANKSTSGGLSLCSALTILFIGLKLCKVIDWSWWWVLAPLWIPWSVAFIVGGGLLIVAVIAHILERARK